MSVEMVLKLRELETKLDTLYDKLEKTQMTNSDEHRWEIEKEIHRTEKSIEKLLKKFGL